MKTSTYILLALLLVTPTALFAQERKTIFESAGLATAGNGASCINLTWKKGSENTAYYLVQRSVDGKDFKTIALVFASEDNEFSNYTFRDKPVASAENKAMYYRIAIVSDQKELTYLPAKKVAFSTEMASVAPAPSAAVVRD